MNRQQVVAAIASGLALVATGTMGSGMAFGQQPTVQVPKFQYDPTFPQPLPEKWAIGAIGGMAVDSHDNIWVIHRPGPLRNNDRMGGAAMTPPRAECCIAAPPVLSLAGELDLSARDELTEAVLAAVADRTSDVVCLDLGATTFIDSEALAAIIIGVNAAREAGKRFRVDGATGVVRRVLDVAGIGYHLRDFDDVLAARGKS